MEISVKIMADVVESFLGALMLDQGLEEVEKFLQAHLFPKLSVSKNLTTCTCIIMHTLATKWSSALVVYTYIQY